MERKEGRKERRGKNGLSSDVMWTIDSELDVVAKIMS